MDPLERSINQNEHCKLNVWRPPQPLPRRKTKNYIQVRKYSVEMISKKNAENTWINACISSRSTLCHDLLGLSIRGAHNNSPPSCWHLTWSQFPVQTFKGSRTYMYISDELPNPCQDAKSNINTGKEMSVDDYKEKCRERMYQCMYLMMVNVHESGDKGFHVWVHHSSLPPRNPSFGSLSLWFPPFPPTPTLTHSLTHSKNHKLKSSPQEERNVPPSRAVQHNPPSAGVGAPLLRGQTGLLLRHSQVDGRWRAPRFVRASPVAIRRGVTCLTY